MPAALVAVAMAALWGDPHEIAAGGPALCLLGYGLVVGILGHTNVEVHRAGFRVWPGPLPAGVRRASHAKEAVRHLFPRHILESQGKGLAEDRYYAAVELADGRWLNVRGPYSGWAGASASCREVARLWDFPEIAAGRSGFPGGRPDWDSARVVLVWGGAFILALAWGIWREFAR